MPGVFFYNSRKSDIFFNPIYIPCFPGSIFFRVQVFQVALIISRKRSNAMKGIGVIQKLNKTLPWNSLITI